MHALLVRNANEIVSLTVMAMMCIALIAGQASASQHQAVESSDTEVQFVRIDTSFRHKGE